MLLVFGHWFVTTEPTHMIFYQFLKRWPGCIPDYCNCIDFTYRNFRPGLYYITAVNHVQINTCIGYGAVKICVKYVRYGQFCILDCAIPLKYAGDTHPQCFRNTRRIVFKQNRILFVAFFVSCCIAVYIFMSVSVSVVMFGSMSNIKHHFDGLVQDCSISSALAMGVH